MLSLIMPTADCISMPIIIIRISYVDWSCVISQSKHMARNLSGNQALFFDLAGGHLIHRSRKKMKNIRCVMDTTALQG